MDARGIGDQEMVRHVERDRSGEEWSQLENWWVVPGGGVEGKMAW